MDNLTPEQQELFDYIDSLFPENNHLVHDFNDPRQYEFVVLLSQLNGRDPERYPGYYKHLEAIRDFHLSHGQPTSNAVTFDDEEQGELKDWKTAVAIPSLGKSSTQNKVVANGVGTVAGGFSFMSLDMVVRENSSRNILAKGNSTGFSNTHLVVDTDTPNASSLPNTPYTAYLSYSFQPNSNSSFAVEANGGIPPASTVRRLSSTAAVGDPVVTAPVKNPSNTKYKGSVSIGLGRLYTSKNTDMDYFATEGNVVKPIGRIPFVGSVTFTDDIITPLTKKNFTFTIKVMDTTQGGVSPPLTPADLETVRKAFSVANDDEGRPRKLVWNLPANNSRSLNGPGSNPIVFQQIQWNADMNAIFYCVLSVPLKTQGSGSATIVSKVTKSSIDSMDGMTEIDPIMFVWHCLGAGTQVRLADQEGLKAIEECNDSDVVMTNLDGGKMEVSATQRGHHRGRLLEITTDQGQSLIITNNHVVMTPRGGFMAQELNQGDEVLTENGTAVLSQIQEIEHYDGMLHNLTLGDYVRPEDNDGTLNTFFANGIQVGDMNAQELLKYKRRNDIEWVKAQVGEFWAKDVESYFAERS